MPPRDIEIVDTVDSTTGSTDGSASGSLSPNSSCTLGSGSRSLSGYITCSSPLLPQVASSSADVAQMTFASVEVPQTTLSPSLAVPQMMLSPSDATPHTALSQSAPPQSV